MITSFKIFESNMVDDYIVIKSEYFVDKKEKYGKIIKDNKLDNVVQVLLINNSEMWCVKDMIKRKMTQDEIESFNIELNANKYNL